MASTHQGEANTGYNPCTKHINACKLLKHIVVNTVGALFQSTWSNIALWVGRKGGVPNFVA